MYTYQKALKRLIGLFVILNCAIFVILLNANAATEDHINYLRDNLEYFKEFTLTGLDGQTMTQEDLKAYKVTVVNGWAPWCSACVEEMPYLEKLNNEYKDRGLQIVGVVADYTEQNSTVYDQQIQDAIEKTGITYPSFISDEAFYLEPQIMMEHAYPGTWVIDSEGNLIDFISGAAEEEQWRAFFDKWLEGR